MITKIIRIMTHFHNHDDNHNHQVSGCSFRDTIELTKHAESLGVAAIGVLIIISIIIISIVLILTIIIIVVVFFKINMLPMYFFPLKYIIIIISISYERFSSINHQYKLQRCSSKPFPPASLCG